MWVNVCQTGTTDQCTQPSNLNVDWAVTSGGCTITSGPTSVQYGTFKAPSTAGTCTITATPQANPSTSATITVNVHAQSVYQWIAPFYMVLYKGQYTQLQSLLYGTTNLAVTWSVSPDNGGLSLIGSTSNRSIGVQGVTAGTYTVTATPAADPAKTASATIVVTSNLMPTTGPASATAGGPAKTFPVDCTAVGSGNTYEVTDNATFDIVPWNTLGAGDTVRIHYNATPYTRQVQLRGQGTATQPIRMCGVRDGSGHLPIFDGENSIPAGTFCTDCAKVAQVYIRGGSMGVAPFDQPGVAASNIIVEGFEFQHADKTYARTPPWTAGAAVYVRGGYDIVVRGNYVHDNYMGFMTSPTEDAGESKLVRRVVFEGNHIANCGNNTSGTVHNAYLQGEGIIVQGNYLDRNSAISNGSTLKIRAPHAYVRNNYIVGTLRTVDFVELQDWSCHSIPDYWKDNAPGQTCDPTGWTGISNPDTWTLDNVVAMQEAYQRHFMYGNIIDNDDRTGKAPTFSIHYFGDVFPSVDHRIGSQAGDTEMGGTLYFYHNTDREYRRSIYSGVSLFDISRAAGGATPNQWGRALAINNAIQLDGATTSFKWGVSTVDRIDLGKNWLTNTWNQTPNHDGAITGYYNVEANYTTNVKGYQTAYIAGNHHVTGGSNQITSAVAAFAPPTYSPLAGSALIGAAAPLPAEIADMPPLFTYHPDTQTLSPRDTTDIGALDFASAPVTYPLTVVPAGTGTGTVVSSPAAINCGAICSANFTSGTPVTLTATSGTSSTFTGWSGDACTGTGTCTVTMTASTNVTATFTSTIVSYPLTVARAGAGTGTVTSSPAGITCGSTCSANFNSGTSVTLTAAAAQGAIFAGWSGGGCTGTGTCTVSLAASTTVTATFNAIPTYPLTVVVAGTGAGTVTSSPAGINCGPTCSANFNSGTSVTLTAAPGPAAIFAGWSGGGCSGTGACTVAMTASTTTTATFTAVPTYPLTVSLSGTSTGTVTSSPARISCGSTCSAHFASGTPVTLTPAAGPTAIFAGWSGGGCSGTGACTVTIAASTSVSATFDIAPASGTLTYQQGVNGYNGAKDVTINSAYGNPAADNPSGVEKYSLGNAITGSNYKGTVLLKFGDISIPGGSQVTQATLSVKFTNYSLPFTVTGQYLNVPWTPFSGTTATSASWLYSNPNTTPKTLWAVPGALGNGTDVVADKSFTFSGFTAAGDQVVTAQLDPAMVQQWLTTPSTNSGVVLSIPSPRAGSTPGYSSLATVIANRPVLTITYAAPPSYDLTVVPAGTGTGTVTSTPAGISCGSTCTASLASGTAVTLTASPDSGSAFAGWSGGGCSGTGTCAVTMSASTSVTATFSRMKTNVTVGSNMAGASFVADGTTYTAPQTFSWDVSSTHTVSWNTSSANGTRTVFTGWADGDTTNPRIITTPAADASFLGNFKTQYQITTAVGPTTAGTLSGAGWYDSGSTATFTASAAAGYQFSYFTGALTGSTNPASLTVTAPATVAANFTRVTPVLTSRPLTKTGVPSSRVWTMQVTNTGTGVANQATLTGVTFTQASGVACTPHVISALPALIGDIPVQGSTAIQVTVDFGTCAANARFTVGFALSANNGSYTTISSWSNQYR